MPAAPLEARFDVFLTVDRSLASQQHLTSFDIESASTAEPERRRAVLRIGTVAGTPAERVFADLRVKLAP